jgi:predicted nuclease of predicted toxin-antitoxin system
VKLKLDENIPSSAKSRLIALGFDTDTVLDEELGGQSDIHVWAAAQGHERVLVTQDLDFSDTRKFSPGSHRGVIVVRLPDTEQWRIGDYLVAWLSSAEAKSWAGCFVIATPSKVRVLRPGRGAMTDLVIP